MTVHSIKARRLARDEAGFTLIELLVVILIIGILAAIAIPQLVGQRTKAQDTDAKSSVRHAQEAIVQFHLENDTFAATQAQLAAIIPSLQQSNNLQIVADATSYSVSVDSKSGSAGGGTFTIAYDPAAGTRRLCSNPGQGACDNAPDARGNLW